MVSNALRVQFQAVAPPAVLPEDGGGLLGKNFDLFIIYYIIYNNNNNNNITRTEEVLYDTKKCPIIIILTTSAQVINCNTPSIINV